MNEEGEEIDKKRHRVEYWAHMLWFLGFLDSRSFQLDHVADHIVSHDRIIGGRQNLVLRQCTASAFLKAHQMTKVIAFI